MHSFLFAPLVFRNDTHNREIQVFCDVFFTFDLIVQQNLQEDNTQAEYQPYHTSQSGILQDVGGNRFRRVRDERPTVTGTLAQREGTGEYLLTPQNTPDGTAAGAAEVKAAAGVDGTVLNFWCNTNGQIVYLLYRSADDILVAYANRAASGSSSVVIPTANVPTAVPDPYPDEEAGQWDGDASSCADPYENALD